MKPCIHLLARLPIAGQAKTRLIPALGAHEAARLARRQLQNTLDIALTVDSGRIYLWLTPGCWHPGVRRLVREKRIALKCQPPGDLGARLAHIVRRATYHSEAPILLGTDCVDLCAEDIAQATRFLNGGTEAVIGPAEDGGYYLLGVRRYRAGLFRGIPWGTSAVFDRTLKRLRQTKASYHVLEQRRDIDRPSDMRGVSRRSLARAGHTGAD